MNREIIFRGKRLDNNEWLYGSHFTDSGEDYIIPQNLFGINDYEEYQIDQNTIGQYTGMKDKNGKKVFEGDIVHVCDDDGIDIGVVKYNEDFGKYIVVYSQVSGNWFDFEGTDGEFLAIFCSEVIGNIYDNPELLSTK